MIILKDSSNPVRNTEGLLRVRHSRDTKVLKCAHAQAEFDMEYTVCIYGFHASVIDLQQINAAAFPFQTSSNESL